MSQVAVNTPMMHQFNALKAENPDCILFFRSGDFYEMFGADAQLAADVLGLALTTRNKNTENAVPMAGVPHHAYESYLNRLVAAGHKVAIAEQMEEAAPGKGLVRREVVRVVTPGTTVSGHMLAPDQNHFLLAVAPGSSAKDGVLGVARVDLSTGEFEVAQFSGEQEAQLEAFCQQSQAREVLLPLPRRGDGSHLEAWAQRLTGLLTQVLGAPPHLERTEGAVWEDRAARERLNRHFGTGNLAGFGVEDMPAALSAAGALLAYLERTQKCPLQHITAVRPHRPQQVMWLDEATLRNLEVFENTQGGGRKHTLFAVLNKTRTAMGARLLRTWLAQPLLDAAALEARLEAVAELKGDLVALDKLRGVLGTIRDLERIIARISLPVVGIADVVALREALAGVQDLPAHLDWLQSPLLAELAQGFDPMADVLAYLRQRIMDEPSLKISEGGYIAAGVLHELDQLRALTQNSRQVMTELETREREHTGIASLKVRYNRVFGYYIEVSKVNQGKVPAHYLRKQTLVNAERFTTGELQALEEKILGAEVRMVALEQQEFHAVRTVLGGYARRMQATARQVALLDTLATLAQVAHDYDYTRPLLLPAGTSSRLAIQGGRHPVVERLAFDEPFVPNDLLLDAAQTQILLITGPNMAGKSTLMRQAALLVLMAQAGSFVPARRAELTLNDRIFTRVGAADNLARGQSTFMLEMNEAANILHNATANSLIILDEIGRGTSTADGISIAWSMAEYLHAGGALTLFATHYHELTKLAQHLPRLHNANIAIREEGDHLVFTRKLQAGEADKSYGIHVAKLAGLPVSVVARAHEVLAQITDGAAGLGTPSTATPAAPKGKAAAPAPRQQLSFLAETHPVLDELTQVDTNTLTPLEALNFLSRLKAKLAKPP